jgi:hypothetical protein
LILKPSNILAKDKAHHAPYVFDSKGEQSFGERQPNRPSELTSDVD